MAIIVHSSFYFSSFCESARGQIESCTFYLELCRLHQEFNSGTKSLGMQYYGQVEQISILFFFITVTRKGHMLGRVLISLTRNISSWTKYPIEGFRWHHVKFCILLAHQLSELGRLLSLPDGWILFKGNKERVLDSYSPTKRYHIALADRLFGKTLTHYFSPSSLHTSSFLTYIRQFNI